MNSIIKSQSGLIRELLDSTQDVGIIIGENQNVDSVGAALGLYLLLAQSGKNVQVVAKNVPSVEVSNLFGVNKITKSFEGNTKILTISVPYREGEIEKVSYNIEGTRLNVNLFAESAGISFGEHDVEYIRKGSSPSLIITIGVLNDQELAGFVDPASVKTMHIDRNPTNSLMGDVVLIDPSFSSISEIVAEMVHELSIGADLDGFQNLMDGITYGTRNFTNPNTSAYAFEAAGYLLQMGAKRKERNIEGGRSQDRPQFRGGRQDRNQNRHDDRRNFPRVDQFQNTRPGRNPLDVAHLDNVSVTHNPEPQRQPNAPRVNPIPTYDASQNTPKEMSGLDLPDEFSAPAFSEGSIPEEIPDDWFLPKVFKGSKKGN